MTPAFQAWSPDDTCGCVVVYEYDGDVPEAERVFTLARVERRCDEHAHVDDDRTLENILHVENTSKNLAIGAMSEALPDLHLSAAEARAINESRLQALYTAKPRAAALIGAMTDEAVASALYTNGILPHVAGQPLPGVQLGYAFTKTDQVEPRRLTMLCPQMTAKEHADVEVAVAAVVTATHPRMITAVALDVAAVEVAAPLALPGKAPSEG